VGKYDVVLVAASAGGVAALKRILADLPVEFPLPIVVVQHRAARESVLPQVLARRTPLTVKEVESGEGMRAGTVYVARPDLHLTVCPDRTFASINGRRIRHVLSSANPLFESAASVFKDRVIAVVLTGHDADGTDGVQAVKAEGGTVIAQDAATSESFSMPRSAIGTGAVDYVLPLPEIAPALVRLAGSN
jgi:two-component system chemotaxis response regulator CheB